MVASVTKTGLCTVSYCEAKNDPFAHVCVVCQANAVEHHHLRNRQSGGTKKPSGVVLLCHAHHELITLNRWHSDDRETVVGRVQFIVDEHGVTQWERVLGVTSPSAEVSGGSATPPESGSSALEPVASRMAPEAAPDAGRIAGRGTEHRLGLRPQGDPAATSPSVQFLDNGLDFEAEITFTDWELVARQVRNSWVGRQWRIGDLVNAGERFSERAEQVWDELGVEPETLFNYSNVAAAYTLAERSALSLPFTYFQAVYKCPERLVWLRKAEEEGWSRAEFREAVYGPSTAAKCVCPECGKEHRKA